MTTHLGTLSRPFPSKTQHVIFCSGKIKAEARQLFHYNLVRAVVGQLNAAHNGIVLWKDGIVYICYDAAARVAHVNNESLGSRTRSKRRGQPFETLLAVHDSMRHVLELADSVAGGAADANGRRAKVSSASIWKLTPSARVFGPAAHASQAGRRCQARRRAAKVIRDEIARCFVYVETVGDIVTLESEGSSINRNGCE